MMNLLWLKTFCTLAEVGHFTQTANILYMTQSGVSQHIKKLERHLNTDLLIRKGKSFLLTSDGEQLYKQGQNLLLTSEKIEKSIKSDDPLAGNVKISSPGSIGLKLYPHMLDIQKHNPALSIDYVFAPNTRIEQDLIDRKIDIGLLTELTKDPNLVSNKIAIEPLVLVTSSNIKTINWHTLIKLGFISHPDGEHHTQQLLSKNFPDFKHTEQFDHKGFSNQIGLILEPVSRGIGFTVLPLHAVNAFHKQKDIKIHSLTHSISETLYICHNRHSFEHNRTKYIKSEIFDFFG